MLSILYVNDRDSNMIHLNETLNSVIELCCIFSIEINRLLSEEVSSLSFHIDIRDLFVSLEFLVFNIFPVVFGKVMVVLESLASVINVCFAGPLKLDSILEFVMLFQELGDDFGVWGTDFVAHDNLVLSVWKVIVVFALHKECEVSQNESWSSAGGCVVIDIDDIALLDEVIKMLGGMEQFFDIFILIFVQNWMTHAIVNTNISIFTADSVPFDTSCVHLRTGLDVEYGCNSSFLDTMHIVHTQWVGTQNDIVVLDPVEDETTFKVAVCFIDFTINNKGFVAISDRRCLFMSKGTSIEEWVLDFKDSIRLSFENNLL